MSASYSVDFVPVETIVNLAAAPGDVSYLDINGPGNMTISQSYFSNTAAFRSFSGMNDIQCYSDAVISTGFPWGTYWTIFFSLSSDTNDNVPFDGLMSFYLNTGPITPHGLSGNISANGWTFDVTSEPLFVSVSYTVNAANVLPVFKYRNDSVNIKTVRFAHEDPFAPTSIIGIQGIAASRTSQPPNCFHPSVKIVTSLDGETIPISEFGPDTKVVIFEGREKRLVKATLLKSKRNEFSEAVRWIGTPYITSPKHLLLAPVKDLPPVVKAHCSHCGAQNDAYGAGVCPRCSPLSHEGYRSFLGIECSLTEPLYLFCHWYHLLLEEPYLSSAICLEGGWMSEGFRHPFGSRDDDKVFEKVFE